ncbi:hypothetical protein [Phreatobacter sp.]|uniref:hypothetical protein n=1 Tax=Phreatobacter sp. TaxID=1966341 RepID=UPI003F6FDEFF
MIPRRTVRLTAVAVVALFCAGATDTRAEWSIRETQGPGGSGPSLEMSYRSSGERFTLLCGGGAAFVSFSPGYRFPGRTDGVHNGHYQVDGGPVKQVRWRITGSSAFVTARFANDFLLDLVTGDRVFIKFPGVEQTYDLSPLKPHAARLKTICGIG